MWLSKYLLDNDFITEANEELVSFGLRQIGLTVIYWISVFTVGCFFQKGLASIVFLIAFSLLRMFSGGYHAKTISGCYFISMLLWIIGFATLHIGIWTSSACILITILSATTLFILVPVDSKNRRLDQLEIKRFRKKALAILLLEIIVEILGLLLKCPIIYEPIALGISIAGVLVVAGIFNNILNAKTKKKVWQV